MNIFGGGLKRQFIARPDAAKAQIVYKWPDSSIPMAAQLTVEPDEVVPRRPDRRRDGRELF
jgi:hypothetical protein